jgi:heme exporter protein A
MNRSHHITPELSVAGLNIVRGGRSLIENLNFTANSGDLIWISGANGSGKTSLLKCLAGLLRPETGEISWNTKGDNHAQNMIAFHGHIDGHKPNLTVEENLEFWSSIYNQKIDLSETINRVGIADISKKRARTLSAGQSRRVALARLLLKKATYWLLDEPNAPMDNDGRDLINDLVNAHISNSGIAIIASHRPPNKIGKNDRHMILKRADNA